VGPTLCPLLTCQWHLILLFLIVDQAGHDFLSFPAALLVSIIKELPVPRGQWTSYSWKAPLLWGASQLISLSRGVPAHPCRLASYRRARRRCTQLPGPGHGSCKHQIKRYGYRPATIRYYIDILGNFGHTCGGSAINLYAFIVFDSK
jgi:hypothetical protein